MRRALIIVAAVALSIAGLLLLEHKQRRMTVDASITKSTVPAPVPIVVKAANQPNQPPDQRLVQSAVQTPSSKQAVANIAFKREIPSRMLAILGLHGESFSERRKAIKALTPPLTPQEIQAAFEYLSSTQYVAVAPAEYALKNYLMNVLADLPTPPTNLLSEFCALYQDKQQDEVTRDYTLQHIADCLLQGTNRYAVGRSEAQAVLWSATSQTGETLAGTALLGLSRVQAIDPTVDSQRVNTVALQMAADPGTGDLSRITALQVCANRQLAAVLPQALELAQNGDSISMRASAIAAVGFLGGWRDLKTLEALKKQEDPAIQPAVEGAIKRLQARLGQTEGKTNI